MTCPGPLKTFVAGKGSEHSSSWVPVAHPTTKYPSIELSSFALFLLYLSYKTLHGLSKNPVVWFAQRQHLFKGLMFFCFYNFLN